MTAKEYIGMISRLNADEGLDPAALHGLQLLAKQVELSGILADHQIRSLAITHQMITPYVAGQVRMNGVGQPVISYGESSFGYDIRVGTTFQVFTPPLDKQGVIDPKNFDPALLSTIEVAPHHPVFLPPHSFALAQSLEGFKLPRNVTGIALGKSTYARANIICNITPLEAGWEGILTIEIHNTTALPAKIYAGEGIAQVLFFRGEEPMVSYADRKGKYQNQTGITLPKV